MRDKIYCDFCGKPQLTRICPTCGGEEFLSIDQIIELVIRDKSDFYAKWEERKKIGNR